MNLKNDTTRTEIAEGLRYTHDRANSNTAKLLEVSSFAYAAIELLAEKGLIDIEVLDRKKKEIAGRLVEKFRQEGIGAAYQDPEHDKYTFEKSVTIDCENRIDLCKASCCRLRFALSHRDETIALTRELIHAKPDDPRPAFVYDDAVKHHAVDPTLPLPAEKIQWIQEQMVKAGRLKAPLDLSAVAAPEYREKALKVVGH